MTLSAVSQVCCRVVAALTLASSLSAGVIFERALPTAGLNNIVSANRSNISWAPGDNTYILGDDFTLTSNSVIDTLSVWEVSSNVKPQTEFGSISLYAGPDNGVVDATTGSPLSLLSSTYSSSLVSGYQYQGYSGAYYDVYKISFSGLNLSVAGGVLWDFGIGGTTSSLYLHASNAGLSGSTQDGADGLYLGYTGGSPYRLTYVIDSGAIDPLTGTAPWDKSSDINVEITGVPEPATFGMLTISAGALLFLWRRRRA